MPWKECCQVDLRREAVELARQPGSRVSDIARRFGVSRRVLYKWIRRFEEEGVDGLADRSRRPRRSPRRTAAEVERIVVAYRRRKPTRGARKIKAIVERDGGVELPSERTITRILHRHGMIDPLESAKHTPWRRFERPEPNDLLQMDFKGHFELQDGRRCHPLTLLDDHSRFCLAVRALPNERGTLVQRELVRIFERYGLPRQILADNGAPWGADLESRHTWLTVWLIDHGVEVTHGHPRHPQTQGKLERMHRTLKAEAIAGRVHRSLAECQRIFDAWREEYNHVRPHESLDMEVPASRYRVSRREYVSKVPRWDYAPGVEVRKVDVNGRLSFRGIEWRIGKPFIGRAVGIARSPTADAYEVLYRHQWIGRLELLPK